MFTRHIGIDYSGAETPNASLKGLRVYLAEGDGNPEEVQPPPSPRKYWTRKGIAEWLVALLDDEIPMLVGIDHGFSFSLRFFEAHQIAPDWPVFSAFSAWRENGCPNSTTIALLGGDDCTQRSMSSS